MGEGGKASNMTVSVVERCVSIPCDLNELQKKLFQNPDASCSPLPTSLWRAFCASLIFFLMSCLKKKRF